MKLKRFILPIVILFMSVTMCYASGGEDAGEQLMHHILDGHSWQPIPAVTPIPLHNITIGPVTIPITRHVIMLLINALLLIVVFTTAFGKKRIVPSGIASALEPLVFFVRDDLVYAAMGKELGEKWLTFFYTLFFFILTSNLIGMIPFFSTATGNLSITGALALMIFIAIIVTGMRKNGFIGFFKNMVPPGLPLPIGIFVFMIELPGLIIRSGVLAIRLFANMIAGHFVIYSLLLLIFLIHPFVSVISVPMAVFIDLLEVLVAIIQAIVFTTLSALFISMAVSHD